MGNKKLKLIAIFGLSAITLMTGTLKAMSTIANKNAYVDSYKPPCFKHSNGGTYCNGNWGTYFYDDNTQKFWMYLTRVNSQGLIIDTKMVEYIPSTKKINWSTVPQPSVAFSAMTAVNNAIAGQPGLYSVNTIKTVEQMKTGMQKTQAKVKQAEQAKSLAETKKKEKKKIKLQNALLKAKEAGTLPSCKKLYWKLQLNPLNLYSEANPEPFKDIEGTEKTYCQLKDGSPTMLQFQDATSSTTGAKYRELKLIDFTGKTKYYPWN